MFRLSWIKRMTTTPVLLAQHTHMTHTLMMNTQTAMTIIIPQKAGALLRLLHQILLLVKRGLWLCAEDTVIHRHRGHGGWRLQGNINSFKRIFFSLEMLPTYFKWFCVSKEICLKLLQHCFFFVKMYYVYYLL